MQVISSAQSVQLANFPNLDVVSKYGDAAATTGAYDFQFLRQSPLFIVSKPEKPIEYLTKKVRNGHEEIMFVRRIRTEIANTVACPNYSGFDIAVGTSNGHIQLHHYKTMEESLKFNPVTTNDAVTSMSFNCQDDMLASLHESGLVQLFGLKTSVRTDLINFDKEVTHIRFHPKRKLHLGLASYNGHVHIYDTQGKKRIFSHLAHQSPCQDFAMSPVNDNCLVSVGYDHQIVLYDTRTKIASIQLSTTHPLSAVAISPCGSYSCVGNLKGQLLAYDFRQLKEPLIQSRNNHNSFVKRVEFLADTEDNSFTEKFCAEGPTAKAPNRRDSMQHFFDHHYKRIPEQRKLSNLFSGDNTSSTRISIGGNFKRLLGDEDAFPSRDESMSSSSSDVEYVGFTETNADSAANFLQKENIPEPKTPLPNSDGNGKPIITLDSTGGGRSMRKDRLSDPTRIAEDGAMERKTVLGRPARSSIQTSTPLMSGNLLSTPTNSMKMSMSPHIMHKAETPRERKPALPKVIDAGEDEEGDGGNKAERVAADPGLEKRLMDRIEALEKNMEFRLEQTSWELKNYTTLIYMKQMDVMEQLQKSVAELTVGTNCLIRSDDFVDEFFRLRYENEELKGRLLEFGQRLE